MKVKVITPFLDKTDRSVRFEIGTVLDWDDADRIADCEQRGLIEVIEEPAEETKPKKTSKKAKQA